MAEIIDLKTLKPDEIVIRAPDREIVISNIPFEVALDVIEKIDELREGERYSKRKLLEVFKDIVVKVLQDADGSIDEGWVRKNVSAFQMMQLIDRIVNPLLEGLGIGKAPEGDEGSKKKGESIDKPSNEPSDASLDASHSA